MTGPALVGRQARLTNFLNMADDLYVPAAALLNLLSLGPYTLSLAYELRSAKWLHRRRYQAQAEGNREKRRQGELQGAEAMYIDMSWLGGLCFSAHGSIR